MLAMKNTIRILLIFSFHLFTLNLLILKPSQAQSRDVFCKDNVRHPKTGQFLPATMVKNPTGNIVEFIYWVEEVGGKTPRQRCKEISRLIQSRVDDKTWSEAFLRDGNFEDHPVICFVPASEDRECRENEIIITLKKGENAKKILEKILGNRIGLELTGNVSFTYGRKYPAYYIDIYRFLNQLEEPKAE
ncbi:MAG: hypothetical protein EWV58_23410 [Microcystis aeruginosa Ma_MB_F_20061100_S19]|jgi:ribosome-binding factor A|uniref:Uncharacterized protein n=1 Tax=Microcystis aeruginosa SPC777 TaxID=482300 RepID=S3JCU5_MICAE|nr:COP23 domain-containing protein [Microcystis aeruginosa]NCS00101.1 hypothetical protein [Microcystis aeruginosa L311-01]OCY14619.1 MAG: hypothetical protein BEV12_18505 [Microcystis aeruginosa CACIAM 03]TRU08759.1 MAG: hypothetical protein EWV58_23410 [Microcystis aeruginosa Ma_MB_F_20061100_S19]TRU12446.1 MAG: hypothetical protein EWV59_08530 [Microcystis aeruginosa Ma_MB_F_20061100_S19D]EPF23573.1 hypothetical protein MAESPC_01203 [Microcystis aeruginosa SPC777]